MRTTHRIQLIALTAILLSPHSAARADEKDAGREAAKHAQKTTMVAQKVFLVEKARKVALSPDGKLVCVQDNNYVLTLHDAQSGRIETKVDIPPDLDTCFTFSPDGRRLAVVDTAHAIRLWDVNTRTELRVLKKDPSIVPVMAFSPDGKTLASGSSLNEGVLLWDVTTGRKLQSLPGDPIFALAFTPDGKLLAAGNSIGEIGIWDWAKAKRIRALDDMDPATDDFVHSLAFLGDNKTLIVAYGPTHRYGYHFIGVRVWDINTGKTKAEIPTDTSAMEIAVSPDERILAVATSADDRKWTGIMLFDLQHQRRIVSFPAHTGYTTALQFSPSGKQLISAGSDGTLKRWDVSALIGGNKSDQQ